ncbi:MAG: hypothetical protein IKK82_11470 [Kiritimatiellae bacterium]|nr:hypothetical protein [Kiritimatiellia bacterium]
MDIRRLSQTLLVAACAVASADAYAVSAVLDVTDTAWTSSFTNAANWMIDGVPSGVAGGALDPSVDYFVKGSKVLRNVAHCDTAFAGNSLHIGEAGGPVGTLALFAANGPRTTDFGTGEGLVLGNGTLCGWFGISNIVSGRVKVEATQSSPIKIYSNPRKSTIVFKAAISGGEQNSLWLFTRDNPGNTTWETGNFVCRFVDNSLSGYTGTINCFQCPKQYADIRASSEWRTEYSADTSTVFPGTLVLGYNCAVRGEEAGSVVSVANIDFKSNSCVNVIYDKSSKKASCVKVLSSFTFENRIRILFDSGYTLGNYPDGMQVPEIAVFKAPAGTVLNPEDFKLEATPFPVIEMYERTDVDGLSTLFLKQPCKVVTNTVKDDSTDADSSFISKANWSDGADPGPDRDYYTTKIIYAYSSSSTEELTFPGHSLAVKGGHLLLRAKSKKVRIKDYRVIGSVNRIGNYIGGVFNLAGRIYVDPSATNQFRVQDGGTIALESEVWGSGTVEIMKLKADTKGYVDLKGMNTNFTGKICLNGSDDVVNDEYCGFVSVSDSSSLGAPLDFWTYDALNIRAYSHLVITNSMVLETPNRGIYVSGPAYFNVSKDAVLAVTQRFTWNGRLTKKGEGTLAIGGEAPFFGTDGGAVPNEGFNTLAVVGGNLRALSSEAFEGVALSFASGTGLEIAIPADGRETICDYGVKNTLIDNPIVFADAKLPVRILTPGGSRERPAGLRRVAILTVKTAAASSLGLCTDSFELVNRPYSGCSQKVVETVDDVQGLTTFSVEYVRGFSVLVR